MPEQQNPDGWLDFTRWALKNAAGKLGLASRDFEMVCAAIDAACPEAVQEMYDQNLMGELTLSGLLDRMEHPPRMQ